MLWRDMHKLVLWDVPHAVLKSCYKGDNSRVSQHGDEAGDLRPSRGHLETIPRLSGGALTGARSLNSYSA
jgi:hypothetical protein